MNMRKMLFIVIPLLFILNNAVSFFIFQSGRTVQQSYNMMLDRVLLYKQIEEKTRENLRAINVYIMDRDNSSLGTYQTKSDELKELRSSLSAQTAISSTELMVRSYRHMLDTFILQEADIMKALSSRTPLAYAASYGEAETTASFIQEEAYQLIDQELSYYQPFYRKIFVQTEVMNHWGVAVFILNTVLSVVLAYWISLRITRPIQELVRTAKQISDGNLQAAPPQMSAHSEFRILAESFGHMQENLRLLIQTEKESLEKDRLVKELELEVLQNQINPHFLFNSLNVLSKLALIEGAEKTSDLTVSMSNLLRYNLRKLDQPVPLRDEVEHAKEYFVIQQARFRERIRFVTEIDEAGLDVLVPVLTLQPLIENVFVHAIEGMEEGAVIKLAVSCHGDETWVAISDNGAGMNERIRESLLHYDREEPVRKESGYGGQGHSTGLGTRNVFRRLELFYDKKDMVDIQSEPGKGTTVLIRIPAAGKGDGYVSPINRGR
ncbi:sensor histidine kinase [Paenibacillus donghaensis]|uniref:sensor histidine kinase n=1 Tax=Paenibacillus donghaensis TaxID=414771 RepID=UPI0018843836|nr:sensor histidine kinase [Paenibacillus donghaensis]MBE9917389.1 sensor histidine kinase [Paenibacillus donghaensis]